MKILYYISLMFILFFSCECEEDKPEPTPQDTSSKVVFKFTHLVDGNLLQKDTMIYVNEAGNPYLITEVKYFISDVTLHKSDGTKKVIDEWNDIYYVDDDILSTLTWQVFDKIPEGTYDSITFVFGITEEKNESFMFVNPPEVNMCWPDVLGGGYHYMMINGKWKDTAQYIKSFNFHLGIGQLYSGSTYNVDSIYAFVQNYFIVSLPNSSFSLAKGETKKIEIIMNIESWFKTPHTFDFNHWKGDIMQKQPAMQMVKENGVDVFSVGYII